MNQQLSPTDWFLNPVQLVSCGFTIQCMLYQILLLFGDLEQWAYGLKYSEIWLLLQRPTVAQMQSLIKNCGRFVLKVLLAKNKVYVQPSYFHFWTLKTHHYVKGYAHFMYFQRCVLFFFVFLQKMQNPFLFWLLDIIYETSHWNPCNNDKNEKINNKEKWIKL